MQLWVRCASWRIWRRDLELAEQLVGMPEDMLLVRSPHTREAVEHTDDRRGLENMFV